MLILILYLASLCQRHKSKDLGHALIFINNSFLVACSHVVEGEHADASLEVTDMLQILSLTPFKESSFTFSSAFSNDSCNALPVMSTSA